MIARGGTRAAWMALAGIGLASCDVMALFDPAPPPTPRTTTTVVVAPIGPAPMPPPPAPRRSARVAPIASEAATPAPGEPVPHGVARPRVPVIVEPVGPPPPSPAPPIVASVPPPPAAPAQRAAAPVGPAPLPMQGGGSDPSMRPAARADIDPETLVGRSEAQLELALGSAHRRERVASGSNWIYDRSDCRATFLLLPEVSSGERRVFGYEVTARGSDAPSAAACLGRIAADAQSRRS